MGLSDFLNIKLKKGDSSDEGDDPDKGKNVPLPPQKPSSGGPKSPPSQSQDDSNNKIPPPPGGKSGGDDMPAPPSGPQKQPSGVPKAPKPQQGPGSVPGAPTPDEKGSEGPAPGRPSQPAPPKSRGGQGDMPAPPQQSETMALPDAPREGDDLDLPGFDEEDLDEFERAEEEFDWTRTPQEEGDIQEDEDMEEPEPQPEVEEEPEEDLTEEPEPVEEPEPQPEPKRETPVHTENGDLYVKAEHYQDLFDSIHGMREGVEGLHNSINEYTHNEGDEDAHYDRVHETLNDVQQKIMNIDTRLFEER